MVYLVDCFNVLYKVPPFLENIHTGKLQIAKDDFLLALRRLAAEHPRDSFRVFVDGPKDRGLTVRDENYGSNVAVRYTLEESADFHIRNALIELSASDAPTVVTEDKEVIFFAKKYLAKIIPSTEFARRIMEYLP